MKRARRILGITVARMPATGCLAEILRQKYGDRVDHPHFPSTLLWASLKILFCSIIKIRSNIFKSLYLQIQDFVLIEFKQVTE
ncbi:MAG: hypothetical protein GY730_01385 [bacterium]|nr:hypothetical protein [bacterium]